MTPFEINLMFHFYTSSAEPREAQALTYKPTIKMLMSEGLVWSDEGIIRTTPRGEKYCEMLKDTPLPIIVDERTK